MADTEHDTSPAVDGRNGFGLYTAARVLVGASSVALGLYLGGRNAFAYEAEGNVAVFAGVAILGGMILVAQARRPPRTSRAGWIAGSAVGAVGLVAGLVAPVQQTCCDAAWSVGLGLPLPWATGHGDTWSQAVGEAWRGTWDPVSAISNAIFWAYAGMIVAVMVGLLRRRSAPDRASLAGSRAAARPESSGRLEPGR